MLCLIALDYLSLSSAEGSAREGGNEYIQASAHVTPQKASTSPSRYTTHNTHVAWFSDSSPDNQNSPCDLSEKPFQKGTASWYGPGFNGKQMANGARYNMSAATVAHKKLPLGTRVCIRNPLNLRVVVATVTDRGPYVGARIIDLSKGVATALDIDGLAKVEIFVL